MKIERKYTAIQIGTTTINNEVKLELSYGEITGPYYDRTTPTEQFDTEEEAIEYAFKESPYSRWLILPIVTFDNY